MRTVVYGGDAGRSLLISTRRGRAKIRLILSFRVRSHAVVTILRSLFARASILAGDAARSALE
jgi:hypothetical protein